jgi:OOP family OmpA-OmpF porin
VRALALLLLASPAAALDLQTPFPSEQTYLETQPIGSHAFATGPFSEEFSSETAEGALTRRVLKMSAPDSTALELIAPIRDALVDQGWEAGFACDTAACGGFDFRFALDVTPAPEMFVNLADFRYLALHRDDERLDLLASPSGSFGYVQITHVGPAGSLETVTVSSSNAAAPALTVAGDIGAALATTGRAVLDDLAFETGSTDLPADRYASLDALAEFLTANPSTTIALVGHTDAEGAATGNMAISERRANAAKALLTSTYGIAGGRIDTYGVGFFAPIAPNDSDAGRAINRRVEAVITSTPDN